MIETNKLTIKYKEKVAVWQLSIEIKQGEKVSVVGQSGCGKTSFLHALAGILVPSAGDITIFGEKIKGIRKGTGIILQKDGLFPWKKVEANIALGIIHESLTKKEKHMRVSDILQELGMLEQKDKFLHELSGGQRQRVAIARSLIQKPDLLLMDEPTGSLDMITKERFQESLHELYRKHDVTTVIVTHDIEEAVYLGQRILVMEDGEVIQEILNPLFGLTEARNSIEFYELCLKVRQVMKR